MPNRKRNSYKKSSEGGDSDRKEFDLQALNEMLNWTFDADKLEELAYEDWKEYHGDEERDCTEYVVKEMSTCPVVSVDEFSF